MKFFSLKVLLLFIFQITTKLVMPFISISNFPSSLTFVLGVRYIKYETKLNAHRIRGNPVNWSSI